MNDLKIFYPQNTILKDLIASIYFIEKGEGIKTYIVYPHTNCNLSIFFRADIILEKEKVIITKNKTNNYTAIIAKRTKIPLEIIYENEPDYEIAINFKPLGICCFSNFTFDSSSNFYRVPSFNEDAPSLFSKVFSSAGHEERIKYIEQFLLQKYAPIHRITDLITARNKLANFKSKVSVSDIAKSVNISQKQLGIYFNKYVGCSPAHFRRIERFRKSLNEYTNLISKKNLTQLSYEAGYTDQAYLIKEFNHFTEQNPKTFFKTVSLLANRKILWKIK